MRLEEFEYIFAPEQARECLAIWDQHRAHHAHRPLAPLQGVRAHPNDASRSCPSIDFELEADKKYIVSVGSVGQPRDFDNRASYTVYDSDKKRFEFKRIEYDIELAADKVLRARLERNFAHRLFIGV